MVEDTVTSLQKEESDWSVIFNPKVKRALDVNLVHTLRHESVVCCVKFSADGKFLATGCNRTAQIYDTMTGQKICPCGSFLATAAEDKQIRIWDIARTRIRNVFEGHQQEVYSLAISLDGRLTISGSGDKTVRIWDMYDGTSKVLTINDDGCTGVTSVAISPNGKFVAAGSFDTVVRIWDVATANLLERLEGHRDGLYSLAFTPDGKGLVSGSLDKTLKYWDISDLVVCGEGSSVGADAVFSKKRKRDNKSSLSAVGSSQCRMDFTGHEDYVLSTAVSHDGVWIVSGSKDNSVRFWDSSSATFHCMLRGHKNAVISVDLSPAGNILATGSGDCEARIWSYTT